MEATKRPWKTVDKGKVICTADSQYAHIAHLHWEGVPYVNAQSDAALIVRAVNTFDQAKAALKDCLPLFDYVACGEVEDRVKQALAAMEAL